MECCQKKLLKMNGKKLLYFFTLTLLIASCHKPTGTMQLDFSFAVDGQPLQQDTCIYLNAAGNQYSVTEAQYFISDVILTRNDGLQVSLLSDRGAHYVDADIASSLTWSPTDEIPIGEYKSISFVFGLSPELNKSYFYTNAPENAMSWPANLGGGYHYMKINGWWMNENGTRTPFNLHSGRGQMRDEEGNITGFIDNNFSVTLPLSDFAIIKDNESKIQLQMDINRWFSNPYIFDFNTFGGSIMQNQEAQEILKSNGLDVFSVVRHS